MTTMPQQDPKRIEYAIHSGYITIATDEGTQVPAYWAHPRLHTRFSSIGLLHDWWGLNGTTRMIANAFATAGYYVIAPDMFNKHTPTTPEEAMRLVQATQNQRYTIADTALEVLEHHHMTNPTVAAVGIGMGGTLAFEAAIKRHDLEASVAYSGFPQNYLGQFHQANTPILAIYGAKEQFIPKQIVRALQKEFDQTPLADQHRLTIIPEADHHIFHENPTPAQTLIARYALDQTLAFLENYLEPPPRIDQPTGY